MRAVGVHERRARLGRRHLLAAPAAGVAEVVDKLVALHATDPPSVYLSCLARMSEPSVAAVDAALYEDRAAVRMLGMRRTVFVVGRDVVPVVDAACTQKIAAAERRKLVDRLEDAGVAADGDRWLADIEAAVTKALDERGEATARELSQEIPVLREEIVLGAGTRYEVRQRATSHVLAVLAAGGGGGRIVRGRPSGSWTGTQYRWAVRDRWLGGAQERLEPAEARARLARRWLGAFGPGTAGDLRWWTGWTAAQVRQAVAAVGAVEVDLDDEAGLLLADDLDPVTAPDPWVALLPALDPTPMGWADRSWYLGPHREALFDRSGNIGPTAWADGRIVGGWAQRVDRGIVVQLLEEVGADVAARLDRAAERLGALLGETRIAPKFRTPLERRLAAG